MRNVVLLAAAMVAITCLAAIGSAATITVYTDETEWQNALGGQYLTEDFADTLLNAGVSYVSTESGHINPEQECYQDVLASQSQNEPMTEWTFEPRTAAFGGDWTLGGPGGSGNSLHVYIAGDSLYVGAISNSFMAVSGASSPTLPSPPSDWWEDRAPTSSTTAWMTWCTGRRDPRA